MMNKKELEAFARETAKGLKAKRDLNKFGQMLTYGPGGAERRTRRTPQQFALN